MVDIIWLGVKNIESFELLSACIYWKEIWNYLWSSYFNIGAMILRNTGFVKLEFRLLKGCCSHLFERAFVGMELLFGLELRIL